MSKSFKLRIAKPCHEDWQTMTPNDIGRHCDNCQKTVVDFTELPDSDIVRFFKNKPRGICGRFSAYQLSKSYTFPNPQQQANYARVAALLAGLFVANIGCNSLPSQLSNAEMTEITGAKPYFPTNPKVIEGTVLNENGEPLMGVEITIDSTMQKTYSSTEGSFQLVADGSSSSVKVKFNVINYAEKEVTLNLNNFSNKEPMVVNLEPLYQGVTTFDIAKISKHILETENFNSDYQILAGDVNVDTDIDEIDMNTIREFINKKTEKERVKKLFSKE